jgi:hypothetical protein
VNLGHSQQESKQVGPRPNFLISRFASIQARRVAGITAGPALATSSL